MKKKHRLEKFFSSVIGSHVDTENSETLPNREDVEKDIERILQILRSENGHISSEDSLDRSELASRLEYFQKGYRDVHGRYNHLLGKITKKFRPKGNDHGSFSIDFSSSDSESSESDPQLSHKKSSRIQEDKEDQVPIEDYYTLQRQLDNANIKIHELETMATAMNTKLEEAQTLTAKSAEREAWIIALKEELQTMSDSVEALQAERDVLKIEVATLLGKGDGMNQRITNLQEENESLRSENAEAFSRIHEMEKSIEKSEVELEQIKSDMQRVNFENMSLKEELEITTKEVANLTQQLTTSIEEKTALRSGNFTFLSRIQEVEKSLADFKYEAEQNLKLVTEELNSRNASLSSENENLKFMLEASDQRNSDLIQRVSAAEDELNSLKSEILRSSCQIEEAEKTIEVMKTDIGNLKVENLNLLNMNNDLNQQLGVIKVENEALASERLDAVEAMHRGEEEISVLSNEIEKVKDENSKLLAQYFNMELELAETNNKFSKLKLLLEATQDEKQTLVTENSALTNKIQQVEKVIDDFKAETNQLGIEKSEMQIKINDLSLELHAANLQSTDLKIAVEAAEEEKRILTSQSSEVLSNFQILENNMKQLQEELGILRETNSIMEQKQIKLQEAENVIDGLKAETEHLRADNSQLKTDVNNLDLELEASKLQLTDLSAKIEQMREENSILEHYHNDLQSQKLDLEVRLNEKLSEILSLQAELGTVQEEATNQIKSFTAQVHDLQRERDLLDNQKNDLEENIRLLTCRSVEDEEMIKNLQEELRGRIHSEEHTLKSQKDSFDELLGNYKKLEACFQESCEKLQFAERKSEELARKEETIQSLEAANEKQRKEITKLEDIRKELLAKLELIEAEKADADREAARLHKEVQNLVVQIRLSNQKLKITETENKEKEEGYKTTMQALREEHRELEGKFVTLSGKYDGLDKELRQLKKLADVEISALANGYLKLESVFKEKSAHIPMQLFECVKELKELKNWFALLKNEKVELSVRLEYKEGIISMMKGEAKSIEDKLAKAEKELASLGTKEEESEKRIKVLEEMLGEKKKEVSDKDEAKREAIRQLCLLSEYHRENCVHLSRYITSVLKRSRRSS